MNILLDDSTEENFQKFNHWFCNGSYSTQCHSIKWQQAKGVCTKIKNKKIPKVVQQSQQMLRGVKKTTILGNMLQVSDKTILKKSKPKRSIPILPNPPLSMQWVCGSSCQVWNSQIMTEVYAKNARDSFVSCEREMLVNVSCCCSWLKMYPTSIQIFFLWGKWRLNKSRVHCPKDRVFPDNMCEAAKISRRVANLLAGNAPNVIICNKVKTQGHVIINSLQLEEEEGVN